MRTVAALFVEKAGVYAGLPFVDLWSLERDARLYSGPFPVVAHPPCARWCRLADLAHARGFRARGDDDGCFHSALVSVRKFGGVLEHPAWSSAWPTFSLPGVGQADSYGFSLGIAQSDFGHLARKATWLYICGVEPRSLPPLPLVLGDAPCVVGYSRKRRDRPEMAKSQRAATPPALATWLLQVARTI